MIKTTVEQVIVSVTGGGNSPLSKLVNSPVPSTTAWNIREIAEQAEKVATRYEEIRQDLLEKYADADEEAGVFQFETQDQADAFQEKLVELLNFEIEISAKKIKMSEIQHASLSASDLSRLEFLLDGVATTGKNPLDGFELS